MRDVLTEIIADTDASWLTRRASIDSIVALGADAKDLKRLLTTHYKGGDFPEDADTAEQSVAQHLQKKIIDLIEQ